MPCWPPRKTPTPCSWWRRWPIFGQKRNLIAKSKDRTGRRRQWGWGLAIGLEVTLDILSAVKGGGKKRATRVSLGFAAETHDAFEYGRQKLLRKGLNFIAVNDVLADGAGFAVDTNRVVLLSSAGVVEEMPLLSKTAVAERLVHHVARALGKG